MYVYICVCLYVRVCVRESVCAKYISDLNATLYTQARAEIIPKGVRSGRCFKIVDAMIRPVDRPCPRFGPFNLELVRVPVCSLNMIAVAPFGGYLCVHVFLRNIVK